MESEALVRAYHRAVHDADITAQMASLAELTTQHPELAWPWFDLGTRYKWLRQWPESVNANLEALARTRDPTGTAEAWNLGIAATALEEWALARKAWDAYGIALDNSGEADEPIRGSYAQIAVQLNPKPRFHEPELLLDGVRYADEVVLAEQESPATARLTNVPVPESGHRFGDVVLIDGDHVALLSDGTPVMNEIMLLEPSAYPTLGVIVPNVGTHALADLTELFRDQGLGAELWVSPSDPTAAPSELVTVGLGATPDVATRLLAQWAVGGEDRDFGSLEQLL